MAIGGRPIDLVIEIDSVKQHLVLPEHSPFVDVGRSPQNQIVLDSPATLSLRHVTIRWSDGWWVQDLSTNGSSLNGIWFRGCTVGLDVDDVLEIEGHVLIIHQLSAPTDVESTERTTALRRLVLRDGEVGVYPSQGLVKSTAPPQQYRLLCELARCWTGREFAPLGRDDEFALLEPFGKDADPTMRLHQSRARLRRWWRTLLTAHSRELRGLPVDLIRAEGDGLRLMLEVDAVEVDGRQPSSGGS